MGFFENGQLLLQVASTAMAGGTTTLTSTSAQVQNFTGTTSNQTAQLPDATTMVVGQYFKIFNNSTSTGVLTVNYHDGTTLASTLNAGTNLTITLDSAGTTNGTWSLAVSANALPLSIANGGSGQTTANSALNAFLPSQTGQNGNFLQTNGTNTSWAAASSGATASITVAGVVFTDLTSNLIVLHGRSASTTTPYATLRLGNGTSGYQVPSGKTLRIQALLVDVQAETGTSSKVASFGYATNDVGFDTSTVPTSPVYCGGDSSCSFASQGQNNYPTLGAYALNFTVPQNDYVFFKLLANVDVTFTVYGYLE